MYIGISSLTVKQTVVSKPLGARDRFICKVPPQEQFQYFLGGRDTDLLKGMEEGTGALLQVKFKIWCHQKRVIKHFNHLLCLRVWF